MLGAKVEVNPAMTFEDLKKSIAAAQGKGKNSGNGKSGACANVL